jgi:aryl-phospho-beta-D-glucosidase BglC (GH1 family)
MRKVIAALIIIISISSGCKREEKTITFTPVDLESFSRNFKGFNLLGKFDVNFSNYGFTEEEFAIMQDLGFNFVRIPLDYRTYTKAGDWNVFLEDEVAKIDELIGWGQKYGVHVCLNLHRAPGYCVNTSTLPANQLLDLWTDEAAQAAFVEHWAFFAKRYRTIPLEDLSFNLVNEPPSMDEADYAAVMKKAIAKIQSISPDRVIFVDGLDYARTLLTSFKTERNIIQAIHVYDPMTLTHYKAEWVPGSDSWPVPVWPMSNISEYLFGPWKPEYHSSLVLEGSFVKDSVVTVNVQQVSIQSTLDISLDDNLIYSKPFLCGPDLGDDWTQIVNTQWGYQNISGKDYSVTLPANGSKITISNSDGDWMTFNKITISSGASKIVIIPGNTSWGAMQGTYIITSSGDITDTEGNPALALDPEATTLKQANAENIPVMIQEFGVYNKTPHTVALNYLHDIVSLFRTSQRGYAMWNLTGSMGIVNSGRTDMTYESFRGQQLDRAMTSIMQGSGK